MWYTHESFKAGRVVRVWALKGSFRPILVLKTRLPRLKALNTMLCNTKNHTNAKVWKSVVESHTGSEILSKHWKGWGQKQWNVTSRPLLS